MYYGNGFHERPRRERFLFYSLLMGLLGVVIGALLVYGLFIYHLLPEEGRASFDPEGQNGFYSPSIGDPDFMDAPEVVERVMPAVVRVNSAFTGRFGRHTSSGSGVVISPDGYIVTNYHVIEGDNAEINVVFSDARSYEAEVVGIDPHTDLALLKIDREHLTYVPLGDSSTVRVGETVLAIGNPLEYQQTVTAGIISGTERQVRIPGTPYYYTFLQTDAGINPGNSGGPLINLRGEVIGINSLKVGEWGFEAIGFAVPGDTVRRIAGDLIEYGEIRRPKLGVWLQPPTESSVKQGVQISEVATGSPAEEGGLKAGDVIIAVGEQETYYLAQLYATLWVEYYPGDQVTVTVLRDGLKVNITVVLD